MRIAVIAAGGVGDFGLAFATAGADAASVGRRAHLAATRAGDLKPSGRSGALADPVPAAAGLILAALAPRASAAPA